MFIYLDESGDLGFKSGSTKYFTICFAIMKDQNPFKRCVKRVKRKYSISSMDELKGSSTRADIKRDLLLRFSQLKNLEIHAITVEKNNVKEKLRQDSNILYNYMVGLSLVDRILKEKKDMDIKIVVDRRTTSITAGFDLDKYIKYKIWYEHQRNNIGLNIHHADSHIALSIQGIDVVTNTIYRKYGNNQLELYNIIRNKIKRDRKLFFKKNREVAPIGD